MTYYYDAFGNVEEASGTFGNPYRYAGYMYDEETRLYYLNARFYDAKIARFMQEDTYLGNQSDPLSLNLYTYCHNNPLSYYDPTGHRPRPPISPGYANLILYDDIRGAASGNEPDWARFNNFFGDDVLSEEAWDIVSNAYGYGDYDASLSSSITYQLDETVDILSESMSIDPSQFKGESVRTVMNQLLNEVLVRTENRVKDTAKIDNTRNYEYGGGNLISQKANGFTPVITPANPAMLVVNDKGTRDYILRSVMQVILGNYTDDVTLAGTAGQIATGFFGVDVIGDVRDLSADIVNWENSWGHAGMTLLDIVGLIPVIGVVKNADEVGALIKAASKYGDEAGDLAKGLGRGFDSFDDLKRVLGSAGEGKAWHHIVEQNQIVKSGFDPQIIHNTNNVVSIESGFKGSIHSQLNAHFSSKQPYTNGKTVRDWLADQSFQEQFDYGLQQLSNLGEMTLTDTGWIFTPHR